jgi:chromosome segregation ATPase
LDQTVLLTVLAIVASVLSAGGIVAQVIGWRRARDERLSKEREAIAKAAADATVEKAAADAKKTEHVVADKIDEREHTGRFQQRLIDRIDALEKSGRKYEQRIDGLEKEHHDCERRYTALEGKTSRLEGENAGLKIKAAHLEHATRELVRENETLREDVRTLRSRVDEVEGDNRALRARLEGRPATQVESHVGHSAVVEVPPRVRGVGNNGQGG